MFFVNGLAIVCIFLTALWLLPYIAVMSSYPNLAIVCALWTALWLLPYIAVMSSYPNFLS